MRSVNDELHPARPEIPVICVFAFIFWGAAAMAYKASLGLSVGLCLAIGIVSLLLSVVMLFSLCRIKKPLSLIVLLGMSCGISLAVIYAGHLHVQQQNDFEDAYIEVRALEDATENGFGASFSAQIISGEYKGMYVQASFNNDVLMMPCYGDVVCGHANFKEPGDKIRERTWENAQIACVSFSSPEIRVASNAFSWVHAARRSVIAAFDSFAESKFSPGAYLMQALVCGYRCNLSELDVYEDFKAIGIVHLVAVSGSHLTLIAMCVTVLLKALRLGKRSSILIQSCFVVLYLIFTACSPSSIRAAIMAYAALASFFASRRGAPLSAAGFAVLIFILFDPKNAVSVSFLLSALSTISIILFAPLATYWLRHVLVLLPGCFIEAIAMTLASGLLTCAYSAALFNQLSLLGVFANVVTAPLFAPLCILGLIASLIAIVMPFVSLLLNAASAAGTVFCEISSLMAAIPYSCIPSNGSPELGLTLSAFLGFVVWLVWPVKFSLKNISVVSITCVCLLAFQFPFPALGQTRIVMLDVGQGDAILLQSEGKSLLIDTGTNDSKVRSALAEYGVLSLDCVLVTHGDDDHMGSLKAIGDVCSVGHIALSKPVSACECDSCRALVSVSESVVDRDRVRYLSIGDEIVVGDFLLTVVWPYEFQDEGGNGDSLSVTVSLRQENDSYQPVALLVGDAEAEQLLEMLKQSCLVHVPILKVGHHGSKAALNEEVFDKLSSDVALIGVGEANRYGHPSDECLSLLSQANIRTYRTDLDGDISCVFTKEGRMTVVLE